MSHNPTEFNEYIEDRSAEIVKQSTDIDRCIKLIEESAQSNQYVDYYYRAFELIDWFRNKDSVKLNDATDHVEDYPEGGVECFWSHCAQVAKRIVNDSLSERVNELLEIREEEEEDQKFKDEQRTYRSKCNYLLKKLGLIFYNLAGDGHPPYMRVEIDDRSHPYYGELKEYWGINDNYVGLATGEYDSRYKFHYEVLKQCDKVIKKAKAKRQEVTA
jgi:hypothetical protein